MSSAICREKLKKSAATFRKNFLDVWPVILFFILLFSAMVGIFGLRYAVIVSAFTTNFKIRRKHEVTGSYFLRLIFNSFLLCLLAYAASLHLIACIAINLIVPFLLILIHSSQFSPKGYFAYTMLFVFLELRPPDAAHIPQEFAALSLGLAFLIVGCLLYRTFFSRPKNREKEVRDSLMELACLLTQIADREIPSDAAAKMESLELKFQNYSYQSHRLFSKSRRHSQIYDMLAILFQRAAYLVTDDSWHVELNGKHTQYLRRLSSFLGRAAGRFSVDGDNSALTAEARELLDDMPLSNGRLRIFSRSFLHMLILLMQTLEQVLPQDVRHRRPPLSRRLKKFTEDLKCRCRLEAFEFRFALRCALVITIGYVISMLLPLPRAYWLPINAFILIQPSMEESEHRMRTRPIGTVLGCLVEAVMGPLLPGTAARFIFALFMLSMMYCATPGTWNHPIFSTCYALTLTSMSMGATTAIELRILYIFLAVALVFLVNRLVFPTPAEKQLTINLRRLQRLLGSYWGIVSDAAQGEHSLPVSGEILSYYGMLYHRCVEQIRAVPAKEQREALRPLLIGLWQIMSELEQIAFLVGSGTLERRDLASVYLFAGAEQKRIAGLSAASAPVSGKSAPASKTSALTPGASASTSGASSPLPQVISPDLSYVLTQYRENTERLTDLQRKNPFFS